jgi:hypothetical protein
MSTGCSVMIVSFFCDPAVAGEDLADQPVLPAS